MSKMRFDLRWPFKYGAQIRANINDRAKPRATRPHTDTSLVDLPTEILHELHRWCRAGDVWSLSLTCKLLYRLRPSTNDGQLDFLLAYERDLPDYITCERCVKLYRWYGRGKDRFYCPLCIPSISATSLSEIQRRLFLRYQLLGTEYGMCVDKTSYKSKTGSPNYTLTIRPKIIDGRLITHKRVEFKSRLPESSMFCKPPPEGLASCRHTGEVFSDAVAFLLRKKQPADAHDQHHFGLTFTLPDGWFNCLLKCFVCATDLEVKVRGYEDRTQDLNPGHMRVELALHRIEMVFDVWQDLGGLWERTVCQRAVMEDVEDAGDMKQRMFEDLKSVYSKGATKMSSMSSASGFTMYDKDRSPITEQLPFVAVK